MNTIYRDFQKSVRQFYTGFSELVKEVKLARENPYEIAGWVKKEGREKDILVYRVTATDKYISSLSVVEIYSDESILFNFSKKDIKYISTLSILLYYKTDARYQVIWECFRDNLQKEIIHIKDRVNSEIIKTQIDQLEKNISIIDGLEPRDSYNLGKLAGIKERMLEESIINARETSS